MTLFLVMGLNFGPFLADRGLQLQGHFFSRVFGLDEAKSICPSSYFFSFSFYYFKSGQNVNVDMEESTYAEEVYRL